MFSAKSKEFRDEHNAETGREEGDRPASLILFVKVLGLCVYFPSGSIFK